jgi:hypothetical protein
MLYQKANGEAWSLPYNPLLSILLIPNLEHFRVELQAVAQLPGLGMLGDAQFKEFSIYYYPDLCGGFVGTRHE